MQAADLGNGDDSSDPGWHDRAGLGAILVERKMSAGALVIVEVRGEDSAQMALIEDHNGDRDIRGESNRLRARHTRSARVIVVP